MVAWHQKRLNYLANWVIRAAHISKNSMVWWPVTWLSRVEIEPQTALLSAFPSIAIVDATSPAPSSSTKDLKSSR